MRLPRIVIVATFLFASFGLIVMRVGSSPTKNRAGTTSSETSRGAVRALFSFNTPLALFPPNAIISLTDDNTTSFLARPAAFGPLIPSKGLIGQLWVGSGFGDRAAEGELGCSDVPGWLSEYDEKGIEDVLTRTSSAANGAGMSASEEEKDTHHTVPAAWPSSNYAEAEDLPSSVGDGADAYLQAAAAASEPESSEPLSISGHGPSNGQSKQYGAGIAGKVVLLSRGGCGFLEKVEWVQRRGGIAVIVGDDTKGGPLIHMYARGDTSNVTIPAIFTSHTTAHILSSLIPSGGSRRRPSLFGTLQPVPTSPFSEVGENAKSVISSLFGWLGWFESESESSVMKSSQLSTEIGGTQAHKTTSDGQILNESALGDEHGHEGLWVTLTQTSGATPFFDTLLVLVVSPLVTLSIVYALLLVRSRIRRRRWRAPKSVVERLPVRTYQTLASGSSSRQPSPNSSSPATPLLQGAASVIREAELLTGCNSDALQQSRTSSRGQVHETTNNVTSEWKKYMGKQVECVVCLEEYVDGVSRVMSLPCGHEFHVDCITPWLTTRRRTCPICKGDVVRSLARGSSSSPRYEPYQDDSDEEVQSPTLDSGNDTPTVALPHAESADTNMDDPEQGVVSPTPSRPRRSIRASWRRMLASGLRSTGVRPSRSEEEDRNR